jgi:hypothetical protein
MPWVAGSHLPILHQKLQMVFACKDAMVSRDLSRNEKTTSIGGLYCSAEGEIRTRDQGLMSPLY